jgi:Tol biopolymer transport system component
MIWTPMSRSASVSYARMTDNGVWSAPQQLTFGCTEGVGDAVFSPDGSRIYFVSLQSPKIGARGMERIWYVERAGDGWSEAKLTDSAISDHPTHWTLSVARNGAIYFTSEIEGVRGEQDLYCARRAGSGYAAAQNLGPAINSDGKDLTPCVSPDESFLIFSRIGAGTRRTDLHISFRTPDGGWTDAVDMGTQINSYFHDLAPCLSPDGKYLFFVSNRAGEHRIYWVDTSVIERLRPPRSN